MIKRSCGIEEIRACASLVALSKHLRCNASSLICYSDQPGLELAPHSLQTKLDFLELLRRRLPRLEHTQQRLDFIAKLLLYEVFLEQSAHRPRQVVRILSRCRCRRLVVFDPQLVHIPLRSIVRCELLAYDRYIDALEARATTRTLLWWDWQRRGLECVLDGKRVDGRIFVDTGVAFATVQ